MKPPVANGLADSLNLVPLLRYLARNAEPLRVQRGEADAPNARGGLRSKDWGCQPQGTHMPRKGRREVEDRSPALLVCSHEHSLNELKQLLARQGVETSWVSDGAQASQALLSPTPPVLVFTATELRDGSWEDVLQSAGRACAAVPVIIVSNHEDAPLALRVWESGGADCLCPPFTQVALERAVRRALVSGFLATSSRPPAHSDTEGSFTNAANYMGSRVLAA